MKIKRVKGFDKNLCCRGFQFEVGKEYKIETDKELELCTNNVFHYCNSLGQVHKYYDCNDKAENRFCEIEVLGEEVTDGDKYGSNHIRIVREITGEELNILKGRINGNTGLFNSGNYNSGNRNSGDYNSGYKNSRRWNSGDCNSGDCNSGNGNLGDRNSGNGNYGRWNSGNFNYGSRNSGNSNYGSCNSGDWNKSSYNNGFFNTIEPTVYIFNKDSGMTAKQFRESKYYDALNSAVIHLNKWVEYTDKEKQSDPKKKLIEGYLKTYTYKEACANWWKELTKENKEIIMQIPNFDKEIFKEITGIDVDEEDI